MGGRDFVILHQTQGTNLFDPSREQGRILLQRFGKQIQQPFRRRRLGRRPGIRPDAAPRRQVPSFQEIFRRTAHQPVGTGMRRIVRPVGAQRGNVVPGPIHSGPVRDDRRRRRRNERTAPRNGRGRRAGNAIDDDASPPPQPRPVTKPVRRSGGLAADVGRDGRHGALPRGGGMGVARGQRLEEVGGGESSVVSGDDDVARRGEHGSVWCCHDGERVVHSGRTVCHGS
mmetsp:Transcript_43555/g.74343  ORF Transcript_43555/g.74343 Transcript_43555/m.74343 type:complete len:228 (+) Transcript_43555:398-1081(+)